jgi:enediyne biosynthesis protein E4
MRFHTALLSILMTVPLIQLHAQEPPLFSLMDGKQTGVRFVNTISETEGFNVLAYEYFFNGGGLAVGDLDNDGLQDLFFTANMGVNKLYRNLGGLRFKDITASAAPGLEGRPGHWKTGVTMADVNQDGLLDIYVCYSGKGEPDTRRNQLFINLGQLKFREAAREYGLDDPAYSNQAAFFDYDRDGDPDMFLLNHSIKKVDNLEFTKYRNIPDSFAGCKLFENRKGKFIDVSDRCGITRSSLTFGLGLVVADINLDGWPDLYVTNDYNEPDYLYINQRDGTFRDIADSALSHMSQFSMGAEVADFNNDGLPDILTLDMLPEDNRRQKLLQLQENYEIFELMQQQGLHRQYMRNMLHLNNGNGTFSEIGQLAGIAKTDWSWTPLFADFDNDGFKDLFISNGYLRDYTNKDFLKYWGDYKVKKAVEREPVQLMDLVKAMPSTRIPNYIFSNNGDLTFRNRQKDWGIDQPAISSAAVYADLDNDGDLEIIVNNINEEAFIYKNNTRERSGRHYIDLQLIRKNGTPATGALVTMYTPAGQQTLELSTSRGYLSAVSNRLHFGLGASGRIDSLLIRWPDGQQSRILGLQPDRNHTLTMGLVPTRASMAGNDPASPVFKKIVAPISYTHEGFGENDFKRQPLMLFMLSNTGPVMARGDLNGDGLDDIFLSGHRNAKGSCWIQQPDGGFTRIGPEIGNEEESAISAACIADLNGDGYPDLYAARGGYSIWEPNTPALQDEVWLNDGKGVLTLSKGILPDMSASAKSCVRPADIDGDGDLDLFVGGRVIPGRYPMTPESFMLINDGKGTFTKKLAPFSHVGMVTDAQWTDLDGDRRPDLVVVGEMMPITVYLNRTVGFEEASDRYFDKPMYGWWNCLTLKDVDGDGKIDLLAGNLGLNVPFRVSEQKPAEMVYGDVDGNGSVDPFFCFDVMGQDYPYVSRDEINEQIYAMRRKFTNYAQYADATLKDILTPEQLQRAARNRLDEQETVLLLQREGRFRERVKLPVQAQFTMVRQTIIEDVDGDGQQDILLLGNQSQNRLKMGAITGHNGCLLKGKGKGIFEYASPLVSGLDAPGDVKSAGILRAEKGRLLIIGASDRPLQTYIY